MHTSIVLSTLLGLAAALPPAAGPTDPALPGPAAERPLARVMIESHATEVLAAELGARGFDVLPVDPALGRVEVVVSDEELETLARSGHAPVVLERGRPLAEVLGAGQLALGSAVPAGYPDLATVELSLAAYAVAHPGLARVVDLTETYGTPATFEGRHLLAMVISDQVDTEEDEPAVLLVAAHHAREIVTPLVALEAISRLLGGYGVDPQITAVVDEHEIWIIPVQNPDGYEHVFDADHLWRKNRRAFPTGIGVDLNRNYPPGWGSGCGGSSSPNLANYEGPVPASEPETQTLIALSDDRHFAKVLDFHSYGQETRYGYGCWTHPLDGFLAGEASGISLAAGWSGGIGSSCCLAGQIHHQMASGAHAFLLETATTFQPTYLAGTLEAQAVWYGIEQFLARELTLSGHVRDAGSSLALDATLDVSGVAFAHGESFASGGPFGRYHATLPAGSYTLTFSAPGYLSSTAQVSLAPGAPIELDVALVPEPDPWQDVGGGSSGSSGTPQLTGSGTLEPATPMGLSLVGGVPAALLLGWVSVVSAPLPLAGGTLHANPFVLQSLFVADAAGELQLATTWPPGLPSATQLWVQLLCEDAAAADGFTLSNALKGTTP